MAERIIKIRVNELLQGDVIAKDVYSPTGSILVKKNSDLNESIIQRLFKNYSDNIFVYRKVNESSNTYKIDIKQIMLKQIEDIIDTTAKKFLKQNKDIKQIKKVIFEILNNDNIIKLLVPIRPLGDNIFNHSVNVAVYSLCVGKEMFLPYNRLKVLCTAALLHDIGMQKIPKEILYKVEALDDREKKIMQMHPRYSFDILQETNNCNLEISSIVLQHHERYDGKGYPNGIKNERIHQMAKIISICDIFDALTSDRPYRQKFEKNESIEYLLSTGENNYSSQVIQGLISSISIYPYGQWVKLSTGEIGIIASQEEENSLNYRPMVMVYIDMNGYELKNPNIIDLSLRSFDDVTIEAII
jgi:HD-GYP domain-containing protein (c-di-GMP phosphodiesterase class II)